VRAVWRVFASKGNPVLSKMPSAETVAVTAIETFGGLWLKTHSLNQTINFKGLSGPRGLRPSDGGAMLPPFLKHGRGPCGTWVAA
jgi:hypothetical protein